jgi:anti-sigma regulatory factor (Ser/Thr protein kinase)
VSENGLGSLHDQGGYGFGPAGSTRSEAGHAVAMSVELEVGATAAAEARAALATLEGRVHGEALEDIRLLVSELVTNSVRHSGTHDRVVLVVSGQGRTVRVEVSDAGMGFEPTPRVGGYDRVGGWGLHLVDHLADRWGVHTGRRTRVWFEIDS